MTVDEALEKINKIHKEKGNKVDGWTFEEYKQIIKAIEINEKGCLYLLGIWYYGMETSYPSLFKKYRDIFKPGKYISPHGEGMCKGQCGGHCPECTGLAQ
jgi:hypothetical protein